MTAPANELRCPHCGRPLPLTAAMMYPGEHETRCTGCGKVVPLKAKLEP